MPEELSALKAECFQNIKKDIDRIESLVNVFGQVEKRNVKEFDSTIVKTIKTLMDVLAVSLPIEDTYDDVIIEPDSNIDP